MNIDARIIKELYGNLPDEFFTTFGDRLYYREYFTDSGMSVWVPKSSIVDCIEADLLETQIFKELKEAFEKNPEYDCITLSNT